MSVSTIAQIASPIAQIIFVVVVGLGYWYTARINHRMIEEMRGQREDMGRPMVVVYTGGGTRWRGSPLREPLESKMLSVERRRRSEWRRWVS